MKLIASTAFAALLATLLARPVASADRDNNVIYSTDGATVTHDCAARPRVKIKARRGTYTFRGTCAGVAVDGDAVTITAASINNLAISGDDNRVTVDEVGNIAIQGSRNAVGYRRARRGSGPAVATAGSDNHVTRITQ